MNGVNWRGNGVSDASSSHQTTRSTNTQTVPLRQPPSITQENNSATFVPSQDRQDPAGQTNQNTPAATVPLTTTTGRPINEQGPPPVMNREYIPGFLAENIGKNIRAEFIIGTNQYVDKTGRLLEVGVNYFVIEDYLTRARIMADLYSVKFVTIL